VVLCIAALRAARGFASYEVEPCKRRNHHGALGGGRTKKVPRVWVFLRMGSFKTPKKAPLFFNVSFFTYFFCRIFLERFLASVLLARNSQ
jgi:hypothetical protein